MGNSASCAKASNTRTLSPTEGRVVHLNGLVEAFTAPIKARNILLTYPGHLICASESILCFDRHRLAPDDCLVPGKIYFVLPLSVIRSEYSVTDFAALAARLLSAARTKSPSRIATPLERCDNAEARIALKEHVELRRSCKSWKPHLGTIPESSSSNSLAIV